MQNVLLHIQICLPILNPEYPKNAVKTHVQRQPTGQYEQIQRFVQAHKPKLPKTIKNLLETQQVTSVISARKNRIT